MSNEREYFEAWAMHPLRHGNYQLKRDAEFGLYESKTEWAFEIWQASRKVALEEAANICTGIAISPSNVVLGVAVECATKIRSLK